VKFFLFVFLILKVSIGFSCTLTYQKLVYGRGFFVTFSNSTLEKRNNRYQAERALKKSLTNEQADAVYLAHKVGEGELGKDGTPAKKDNYTENQLYRKAEILKNADFSEKERRILMEKGVVGEDAIDNFNRQILSQLEIMQLLDPDAFGMIYEICNSPKSIMPKLGEGSKQLLNILGLLNEKGEVNTTIAKTILNSIQLKNGKFVVKTPERRVEGPTKVLVREPLTGNDSLDLLALGEQDPKATMIVGDLMKNVHDWPLLFMGLEEMNIRGPQIVAGFNDFAKSDLETFATAIRKRDRNLVTVINQKMGPVYLNRALHRQ
jgi:hypothetical protein